MHHPCITSWRYALVTQALLERMLHHFNYNGLLSSGTEGAAPREAWGRSQADILSTSFSYSIHSLQPCQVHASIPTLQMATVARGSWSQNSNPGRLNPELFLCKGLQGRKDGQAHTASQASISQDPELPLSPASLP